MSEIENAYQRGYEKGATDMESAKKVIIDSLCEDIDTYREKMFYLMNRIDELSVEHDTEALRKLHYENMKWISSNFLVNDYFDSFMKHIEDKKE